MRSAHHQGDLEVDKGVGKQECSPWLKLEPNMATECMYTYFLYHRLPKRRALCLQAFCLLTTNPKAAISTTSCFTQVGAMPAKRCRTADGAVRRLAPIPLELPPSGGLPHLRRGESEALPPEG